MVEKEFAFQMDKASDFRVESNLAHLFLLKYFAPALILLGGIGVFWHDLLAWRVVFVVPFFLAAAFHFSLATIQVRDGTLRYRRFLKWTDIRENEVLSVETSIVGLAAFVRLNRFIFPWGRLYFVLDENREPNPFRRADHLLLRYLQGEKHPVPHHQLRTSETRDSWILRLTLACCGGILASLVLRYVLPHSPPPSALYPNGTIATPGGPIWIRMPVMLSEFLAKPGSQIAWLIFLVFLALRKRRTPKSWMFAFVAGFCLATLVIRLF